MKKKIISILLGCCIFTNVTYVAFAGTPNLENDFVISETSTNDVGHTIDKISDYVHSLSSDKLNMLVENTDEFIKNDIWLKKELSKLPEDLRDLFKPALQQYFKDSSNGIYMKDTNVYFGKAFRWIARHWDW